jgi:glycosyltransferase involved in cell wall biosynthesis
MRILLTVHQFLPEHSTGTEVLTLTSALALKERGHTVRIVTGYPARTALSDHERFDQYEYRGIPVDRFKRSATPMGGQDNFVESEYNNLLVAEYFDRLVDVYRPDVVHFFHLMRLSASIVDVCARRQLPMVLTPTDFWFMCPTVHLRLPDGGFCGGPSENGINCLRHIVSIKKPGAPATLVNLLPERVLAALARRSSRRPFARFQAARHVHALSRRPHFVLSRLRRIDRILAPTKMMLGTLERRGLDPSRLIYCPYGIELPAIVAPRTTAPDSLRVGFIGTLAHVKGAHVLLEAIRLLPELNIRVLIYGKEADSADYALGLRQLAHGDRRVEFLGTFPNDQIGLILAQIDVLVVPSVWVENTPLVVYSAQAVGCPIIASDVGGVSEVVTHEDNGLLFPAGDPHQLALSLARLAGDRALLAQLSRRARMPKPMSVYVDELINVYRSLLESRATSA